MMTDPIADMISRIRNASLAKLERAEMPASALRGRIAEILRDEGYIVACHTEKGEEGKGATLSVILKYGKDRTAAIAGLQRTSRPGRRIYVGTQDLPRVHNGMGIAIVSTSKGVMTDAKARKLNVGGEVLCEVW